MEALAAPLLKSGYGDYFKGKGNAYEIKNKKVVPTKEFSFPTTREQRFGQYFKELYINIEFLNSKSSRIESSIS